MAVVYRPVAKGISLARNISFPNAYEKFGKQMLSPDEIDKFAKKHPWRFRLIMRKTGILSSAICLSSDAPLRSLIKDGALLAESKCGGELHKLAIPEASLASAGIDLEKENPFLIIKGGYIISKSDGNTFTLTIDPAYESTLKGCLSLFSHNGGKPLIGWFKSIGGVPVPSGAASPNYEKGKLFCFERDDSKRNPDSPPLGPVRIGRIRRGAGLCDGGRHSVSILGSFLGASSALYKDECASASASFKEMMKQTWGYLKEIARGEWGRQ